MADVVPNGDTRHQLERALLWSEEQVDTVGCYRSLLLVGGICDGSLSLYGITGVQGLLTWTEFITLHRDQ